MNGKKWGVAALALAALILVIVLAIKLISGAIHVVGSLANVALGIGIVIALVIIVLWMFRYAAKSRKR